MIPFSQADTQHPSALQSVTGALASILKNDKLEKHTRLKLGDIVRFISEEEEKDKNKVENAMVHLEVSILHRAIKHDLSNMYTALKKKLLGILDNTGKTLENSEKALADMQEIKVAAKDIASKIGKVTDATDKIATTTQSYRDILAQNPAPVNKPSLDPKVLSDMERRA
jgi:hypothetical protein